MTPTRTVGGFVLAVSLTATSAAPVAASSTWSDPGYQWNAHAPFTVRVADHTTGGWPARIQIAAADWTLAPAVDVVVGNSGKVDVYNGYYGPTRCAWASFYLRNGSVSHVTVWINDTCQDSQTEDNRQYAICQEMGHALGLGDFRTDYPDVPSCMAPQRPGPHPNQDDYDQLTLLYGS